MTHPPMTDPARLRELAEALWTIRAAVMERPATIRLSDGVVRWLLDDTAVTKINDALASTKEQA